MSSPQRIELLQGMPIFGAMRDDTLEFILARTRSVTVRAGEYFFREGDAADSMFVLEAGRVAVLKRGEQGDLLMRHLGQGDCFGEMALLDLLPRSASVRADADCAALELGIATLHALFEHDVEQFALVQMNMGREISRRLRQTDDLLFRASVGAAPLDSQHLPLST
jgi:CRP-like cAMP-binding protein